MKLIWTDRAVQDIELIADYISQDSEEASARWVRRIIEKTEEIPLFPRSGRIVPEYNLETVREKIYGNYRIIYEIKSDAVELIAVRHAKRMLGDLFDIKIIGKTLDVSFYIPFISPPFTVTPHSSFLHLAIPANLYRHASRFREPLRIDKLSQNSSELNHSSRKTGH